MVDVIIYMTGLVCILAALTFLAWALGYAFNVASKEACKQILRYRRLSWLRYWAARLEREGLLSLDEHYRAVVAASGSPVTGDEAQDREWDALRRAAAEAQGKESAATADLTETEMTAIRALVMLAKAVYPAMDDSEEFEGDHGRCHSINGQDFDDVSAVLDTLDELPDGKPGVTLAAGGKAEWALRRLIEPRG